MVINFLIHKISREIDSLSTYCSRKGFSEEKVKDTWNYIFSLAEKIDGSEEEKNAIYEELDNAYELNRMLMHLTRNGYEEIQKV